MKTRKIYPAIMRLFISLESVTRRNTLCYSSGKGTSLVRFFTTSSCSLPMRGFEKINIPLLTLQDKKKIPLLAFGTGTAWFKDEGNTKFDSRLVELTKTALKKGYHHLDCAEMYGTEEEVGIAIKESGIPRSQLFITNKVAQGIANIDAAVTQSLEKMGLEYFDLYLIHIPFFAKSDQDLQDAWKAMEQIKTAGKARSIGVSNYTRSDLEATLVTAVYPPVINQIEYHPYLQRSNDYIPWMREKWIQVGSFKGLTPAFRVPSGPLEGPLARLAKKYNTSVNVLLLCWLIQNKVVAVTTTTKPERLDEYAKCLEVELSEGDLNEITNVGGQFHFRTSWNKHFEDDDRS